MRHATSTRREILSDRRTDQRMEELERPRRRHDLRRGEPIGGQLGNDRIELRQLRHDVNLGAGAEHGERARERDSLRTHPPQPGEHRGTNRGRCDQVQRRYARTPGRQPFTERSRQQLAQKQRVPAGELATGRAKLLVGAVVQLSAHDRTNSSRTQRPRRDPIHTIGSQQALELAAAGTGIAGTQTQHQQQRKIRRSTAEIAEPGERGIIDPLRVIDEHHERSELGAIRAQPIEPVNRGEPISRWLPGLHAQRTRAHPRNPTDQPTPMRRGGAPQHRLKQLAGDPERHVRLELRPPRPEHSESAPLRAPAHRRQDLTLADPSRTLDHDHRSQAVARRAEQNVDALELSLALEQPLSADLSRGAHHPTASAPSPDRNPGADLRPIPDAHRANDTPLPRCRVGVNLEHRLDHVLAVAWHTRPMASEHASIDLVGRGDFDDLLVLARSYCDFYDAAPSDGALIALFEALSSDPTREGVQLLARDRHAAAIGFATVYWSWSTNHAARIGVMNDLFVVPEARGTGLAEQLIGACQQQCRARGAMVLAWQTAPENRRAQRVYERVGATREQWVDYWLAVSPMA